MTQLENLELLYNQFFNIADEIKSMVENEDYNSALEKLEYKDKLMKKLSNALKTVSLSDDDNKKLSIIKKKLHDKEQENIALFAKIQHEIELQLNDTKKKVKVGTAYSIRTKKDCGVFADYSE